MKKIILNQKSYLNYDEMEKYKKEFDKLKPKNFEFVILPPILYLSMFKNSNYKVGTQNFFSYISGSFTGELNLEALKYIGINYTLIAHFERRKLMEESYAVQKEKLFKSLNSKCYTILCVGENKKTRKPFNYVKKELNYFLKDMESTNIKYLSIAYEPNWAIGSGDVQDVLKIERTINKIKEFINKKYQIEVEVYYGGSISKDNIKEIFSITDGIVLGKVSTNIDNLKDLIKEIE